MYIDTSVWKYNCDALCHYSRLLYPTKGKGEKRLLFVGNPVSPVNERKMRCATLELHYVSRDQVKGRRGVGLRATCASYVLIRACGDIDSRYT